MRSALINSESGKIENIIELPDDYDPEADGAYSPQGGFELKTNIGYEFEIGGTFINDIYDPPAPVEEIVPEPTILDRIDALELEIIDMKERAAAVSVSSGSDAEKVRDAVVGPL